MQYNSNISNLIKCKFTNKFKAKYTICRNIELPTITFETKTALKCSLARPELNKWFPVPTDLEIIVAGEAHLGAGSHRVRDVQALDLHPDAAWNLYLKFL